MELKITGIVNAFCQAFMVFMFMNNVLWLPSVKHHDINCSLDFYDSTQRLNIEQFALFVRKPLLHMTFFRLRYAADIKLIIWMIMEFGFYEQQK